MTATHNAVARQEDEPKSPFGNLWHLYLDELPDKSEFGPIFSGTDLGQIKVASAQSCGYAGSWRRDGDTWIATWSCDPNTCPLDHDDEED